jgi:hypothetical protein
VTSYVTLMGAEQASCIRNGAYPVGKLEKTDRHGCIMLAKTIVPSQYPVTIVLLGNNYRELTDKEVFLLRLEGQLD